MCWHTTVEQVWRHETANISMIRVEESAQNVIKSHLLYGAHGALPWPKSGRNFPAASDRGNSFGKLRLTTYLSKKKR